MDIEHIYCNTKDSMLPENKDKIVLTNETYALIKILNELVMKLGRIK